ncbi:hypothetical protein AZSI13_32630 [Azospira sp. I13]|uniref:hypothetical protein n=1 Tax=Azospira sp. I13 TaxID=1765050 RepID=UPI000D4A8288|nr:hypothetical protein [Azospira sp. I13]GBG03936.1 hypothetical protein AZSI13_32630 [Azospira sp. I13]
MNARNVPVDLTAQAELAQAVAMVGRFLPMGISVSFYRPEGEPRVAVEVTGPDGATNTHWADQVGH